jgi:hypothetical protein
MVLVLAKKSLLYGIGGRSGGYWLLIYLKIAMGD